MRVTKRSSLIAIALAGVLVSCGTIRTHRQFAQALSTQLTVGVGGVVVRMNKLSDLPNAFGGRDIWGGKVDRGFSEITLAGIEGTTLLLDIVDRDLQSSETVMDRYKPFNRGVVVDIEVNQTINFQASEGPVPHRILFDTTVQRDFVISGIRVTFLEVQPYSVRYTIEDLQANR